MVAIYEYRIPLPFTIEEYEIAQLYMVAKYSASESTGDNGDGVEILKNEPFVEKDRRGQYTHKVYHLASKLPSWLVSLLPKKALILEEEAWNAYPHCTTILKCPFLNKFKLILDSTHVADRGTSNNALNLDPKTLKKRQVEYIDIAMDQPERYVEEEDPTLFASKKTGRGPLREGWQQNCEPVMCAYKCVTVDVPYWGFGSRIEKFISKNAQRKILLEGHRKCFCWLDEWFGLTMEDVRRMEYETAEAIRRARALVMSRAQLADDEEENGIVDDDALGRAADSPDLVDDSSAAAGLSQRGSNPGTPRLKASPSNRSRELTSVLSNRRRPSLSLVGPSFTVGITTLSASEVDQAGEFALGGSAPPMPTLPEWKSSEKQKESAAAENAAVSRQTGGSCESFNATHLNSGEWDEPYYNFEDQSSAEVSKCVDVLDRVIAWTKALRLRKSGKNGTFGTGIVAPVDEKSGEMAPEERNGNGQRASEAVEQYVGVLDSALSVVKRRPSKSKLT
ncbi:hypothetical protein Mapa_000477 [Marchantia paleacea]|nr:hypothetical protein Mapa_000477 [Marchantia paleacea]